MMLATFVYPLLLQPLLLYYQRLDPALEQQKHSFSIHPFGGYTGDYSDVERNLSPVAGPAKTALFSLASTFQLLTNTALRRLIFTALLHPLSPDATGVPTLRSTLEVATIKNGRKSIRLDTQLPHSSGDRMTYHFGTTPGRRRESRVNVDLSLVQDDGEACIFVLSPALAEVLEFRGEDMSLFARTKPNPYRRALLRCLDVPCDLSDIRELAVCTIDAAMSASDSQFASEIVFGTDLKKFADDIPSDERDLDSTLAHALDDRDIGGGISESRTSLRRSPGGKVGSDLTGEIVKALCRCIIVATKHRQRACEWKIEFDELASHSLLYVIRQNRAAMETAAKTIAQLWKQTASFIAAIPANTSTPMGGSDIPMEGAPSVNDPEYDKLIEGALMNFIFFDAIDGSGPKPVVDEFLLLERESQDEQPTYSVPIGLESSFDALCGRIGRFLLDGVDADATQLTDKEEVFLARLDVRRLMKLDALLSLVKDLAATNGALLRDSSLAGIAISAVGRVVDTKRALVQDFSRRVYAPLSTAMVQRLFGDEGAEPLPESGSLIDLAGKPLLPCVCEVPAHAAPLFAGVNGVVSEGVTWQSLYIVFSGEFLILAHPLPESGSIEGRVITSCLLERITVLKDFVHDDSGPPARRLILSHKWFSGQPPQLFLLDAVPKAEKIGPFERKESIVSTLDVWFEDQMSADRAYQILTSQAFVTKAMRGFRMEEFFGL